MALSLSLDVKCGCYSGVYTARQNRFSNVTTFLSGVNEHTLQPFGSCNKCLAAKNTTILNSGFHSATKLDLKKNAYPVCDQIKIHRGHTL